MQLKQLLSDRLYCEHQLSQDKWQAMKLPQSNESSESSR